MNTSKMYLFAFFSLAIPVICILTVFDQPSKVRDLARGHQVVLVAENDSYIPFIVLENEYNKGSTLLIRKEVLNTMLRYNEYDSYYPGSEIDLFLNNGYYAALSGYGIADTEIDVLAKSSIGHSGQETEKIIRKIFLLSYAELGLDTSANAGKEGKKIGFFSYPDNRLAYGYGNNPSSWFLRSPNPFYASAVYCIGETGVAGIANAFDKNGIRPAFCVPSDTEIFTKNNKEGKEYYLARAGGIQGK